VFDGIESARSQLSRWYGERLSEVEGGAAVREGNRGNSTRGPTDTPAGGNPEDDESLDVKTNLDALPEGVDIIQAAGIVDRKSVFVGRACRITRPAQVCP
jgi:hypothetical protein